METVVKIKDVIENLSQLFILHGFPKITAENFRKAKFDKAEAALPLLDLIFEIITGNGKINCPANQRLYLLIIVLKRLDYPRLSVLIVSDVKRISSRELLFVFGFLLVRFDVISNLRLKLKNELSEEILNSYTLQDASCSGEGHQDEKSLGAQLNELIVLRKKIEFAFRNIYSVLDMYEKLLKKYDSNEDSILKELNTNNSKIKFKHISVIELLIKRNLKLQKQLVDVIQRQQKLVKLHTKWIQNEQIFWKWMTSVSDEVNASINEIDEFTDPEKPFPNRLLLLFLLSNDPVLLKIHNQLSHHFNSSKSILGDFKDFSLKSFLYHTMQKHAKVCSEDEPPDESESKVNCVLNAEVFRLEKQIRLLEENNRSWLSNLLSHRFPDLIQLPVPRR